MRPVEVPTSKAKLKLLDCAELQVARKGFDAVSVRDITQLAKANVAAVNYHFGSREGMMALMMARRMNPIHEEQLQNLDLLEKKRSSKAVPLEELLDAWLRPLFLLNAGTDSKGEILRFSVARILFLPVEALPQPLQDSGMELWARYSKAFAKCLKDIPAADIGWRMHLLMGATVQSLMGDAGARPWIKLDDAAASVEQRLSCLLRLAAPMMREGGARPAEEEKPKGPQATFDF